MSTLKEETGGHQETEGGDRIKLILKSFVIKAVLILIGWTVLYYGFIKPDGRVDQWLTSQVVNGTKVGLEWLGYDTTLGYANPGESTSRMIYIDGQAVVLVADACNGLELMVLFIGFLLCFPGPWKYKAIIIPLGTLMVFVINVIREVILSLNYKFFQETFDFNHKYTYVFFVYLFVFLIWRYWLNNYSAIGRKVSYGD